MSVILQLAFQSMGIVYGDIGTSPMYVFASTFTEGIKHNDDILGVLSLIFYTVTLIPFFKYVFVVLRANDNGDGTIIQPFNLFNLNFHANIQFQLLIIHENIIGIHVMNNCS